MIIEIWKVDMIGEKRIAWYPEKKKKKAYEHYEKLMKKHVEGEIYIKEV